MHLNKFRAFLIHLTLSVIIFLSVVALAARVWYPDLYFEGAGVWSALRMVVLVDVGLGPLMTLILFRQGKPGLTFDLSVVAAVQVFALLYGVHVLYTERPVLTAFHDGMFVCLTPEQSAFAGVEPRQFVREGQSIPVAVLPPLTDAQKADWERKKLTLPEGYPKHPAFVYGERMQPFEGPTLQRAMADDWDLSGALKHDPGAKAVYDAYLSAGADRIDNRFFVFTCGTHQYMLAAEPKSGRFDQLLDISFVNAQRNAIKRWVEEKRLQREGAG